MGAPMMAHGEGAHILLEGAGSKMHAAGFHPLIRWRETRVCLLSVNISVQKNPNKTKIKFLQAVLQIENGRIAHLVLHSFLRVCRL